MTHNTSSVLVTSSFTDNVCGTVHQQLFHSSVESMQVNTKHSNRTIKQLRYTVEHLCKLNRLFQKTTSNLLVTCAWFLWNIYESLLLLPRSYNMQIYYHNIQLNACIVTKFIVKNCDQVITLGIKLCGSHYLHPLYSCSLVAYWID